MENITWNLNGLSWQLSSIDVCTSDYVFSYDAIYIISWWRLPLDLETLLRV